MAKRTQRNDPIERTLLRPVMAMFKSDEYLRRLEVPLGQRHIDLLCVGATGTPWVAVELKVRDWRNALVQAMINHQLVDKSYVALWHQVVPSALKHRAAFEQYQVGLIQVGPERAEVIFEFPQTAPGILKWRLRELVMAKLDNQAAMQIPADEAISLLPA